MDDYEDVDCVFSWTIKDDFLTLKTVGSSKTINLKKQFKSCYATVFSYGTYIRFAFYDGSSEKFEIDPSMLDQFVPLFKKFAAFMCEIGKKRGLKIDIDPILGLDDMLNYEDFGNQDTEVDRKLCLSYTIKTPLLYIQSQCTFMIFDFSDVATLTSNTSLMFNFVVPSRNLAIPSENITFYSDLSLISSKQTQDFIVDQMKNMTGEITEIISKQRHKNKCIIC